MKRIRLAALCALFLVVLVPRDRAASAPEGGVPRFRDVTAAAGIDFVHVNGSPDEKRYIFEAKGGGVGALDYDNDGWMDLVFAQGSTLERVAAGTSPTPALYRNRRDGTFEDVTEKAGLAHRGWGMGVAVADYDNDGWADLYLTYLGPDVLYRNNGDGTFTDVTARSGIDAPGWSASAAFGDFDADGVLDFYVASYIDVAPDRLPEGRAGGTCAYLGVPVLCGPRGLPGAIDRFFRGSADGTFA